MSFLIATWFWVHSVSATVDCVTAYREGYQRYSLSNWPSRREADAHKVYKIYIDASTGLVTAYEEARPLFEALGTPDRAKAAVLAQLVAKMESNELCARGQTLSLKRVLEILRR